MRIKNVLRNSMYSTISYLVIFILGIINRKVFLKYLNVEFLGYEGLFSNIFSLLSLAELGVGTVITYNLYKEIASKNEEQITKLMMMYKYMYRIIGLVVGVMGLALLPFLKYIITDNVTDWNYISIIFILQLLATLCTYLLSYKRVIYVVDQKQFICVKIDTLISISSQIIKIAVLIVLKSYVVYLLISILNNILTNIIISYKCNKDYPYVKKVRITKQDFIERRFFKDIKNFMIHKISYIVYGGVDNIVISMFLGIVPVGLMSNYMLIINQMSNLINRIMVQPMTSSIGNLVYGEEKDRGKQLFFAFNLMSFILSTFISISYMVLFQPIIKLWLGSEYLLSISLVLMLSINSYIGRTHNVLFIYRDVFGEYERDRKYMVISAITNLVLSILFLKIWGLTGVVLGTIIGHLFIIFSRIQFVFKIYINASFWPYIIKHFFWSLLALVEGFLTYYIASFISVTIIGILGKLILCLIIPNTINFLVFYKTKDFKIIKIYIRQILNITLQKVKRKVD